MNSIGMDVHKNKTYLTEMDGRGRIVRQAEVATRPAALRRFFRGGRGARRVVMESTWNWPWVYDCVERCEGVKEVKLAHPLKVKAIASARIKTDKIDSQTLAHLLRADLIPCAYAPPREVRAQRDLLRYRASLVRMRTRLKNKVHAELARAGKFFRHADLFGKGGLEFLAKAELPEATRRAVRGYAELIVAFTKLEREAHAEIEARVKGESEEARLVMSIPGIGHFTALLIVSEIGAIGRFRSKKLLAAYAGLVPSTYSSGGKTWNGRITKQGNRWLRWAMVQSAHVAKRHDARLKGVYEKLAAKHGKAKATVAVAHKLLRVVWGVWTGGKPYVGKEVFVKS